MKTFIAVIVFATILALNGCGADAGAKFIGKWSEVGDDTPTTMKIERNGESFILRMHYDPGKWDFMNRKDRNFAAQIEDGLLVIKSGRVEATVSIDDQTGYLITGNEQFEKMQ